MDEQVVSIQAKHLLPDDIVNCWLELLVELESLTHVVALM